MHPLSVNKFARQINELECQINKYDNMHRDSSKTTRPTGPKIDYDYFCLKVVVVFFKFLGFAPWNVTRISPGGKVLKNGILQTSKIIKSTYSRIGAAYNILLIAVAAGLNVLAFRALVNTDYPLKTQLTVTIEMIQSICGNIIVSALRLLVCVKQNTVVNLFNRFINIDATIVRLANDRNPESSRLFFALLFLANILTWIIASLSETHCYDFEFLNLFNDVFPAMMINWFIMEYVIILKLIEKRFQALNRILLDCSRSSVVQPVQSAILGELSLNAYHSPKIISIRRAHTILYEITCSVAEFFSPPILLTIAFTCFTTIYNAYYLITPFVLRLDVDKRCVVLNSLFWLLGLTLPVVMLSAGVDRTNAEMRKTADVVHKLLARSTTSREDKAEFQQFSLELLQRDVEFTACGLFPLNCTLIHSIFGMIVTYLIILFQFQMAGQAADDQKKTNNSSTAKPTLQ